MTKENCISKSRVSASNRFGFDYQEEAGKLGEPVCPIIDGHAHINGPKAAVIYRAVMDLFGVERVYSQTQIAQAGAIRAVLGERIRFVAVPEYMHPDKAWAFREGFVENVHRWHEEFGARMVKFWGAPRLRDYAEQLPGDPEDILGFDSPWRMKVAEAATGLGMALMVHVADPDTWFATKYADAGRYGTKRAQYESLGRLLDAFDVPCLIAHMGGFPEDLSFLDELLERHPRAVLDTSATKWQVRELSRHSREGFVAFFERHAGRVVFGSDIVTSDAHLAPSEGEQFGSQLAASEAEAFDLYASRYWALRTMFETEYEGESNIADPDLMMVEPEKYGEMSAPQLVGRGLPGGMLEMLYRGACCRSLDAWYRD